MTLPPWEYLLVQFRPDLFPDVFWPVVIASAIFLVGQVVLYNLRTRQLHRYEPLVTMQEWLLWTGIVTWFLVLVEALFVWYFLFVLVTLVAGLACYAWIRYRRFPPEIEAYAAQLRRQRFYSEARYRRPEATIRSRSHKRRRR
ncbi:MAG TPA: hypothetical protein VFW86_06290 [Candidatus Limnocylindrales bacterium]|nr:hypothetical protein [Candidatus Limnocylindrales bacterium]